MRSRSLLPTASPRERLDEVLLMLRSFGPRGWTIAVLGAAATFGIIGLATALFDNPLTGRQLAARPQDYAIWAVASVVGGLIFGSFAVGPGSGGEGKAATGGFLSAVAVGCPICNKVAVTLLGTSGALNIFGPAQIFIGVASLALLAWALVLRAQSCVGACPAGESPPDSSKQGRDRAEAS